MNEGWYARGMAGGKAAAVAGLLLVAALAGLPDQVQAAERRIVVIPDADYFGADYKTVRDVDLEACKASCLDDRQCQAFTYNVSARWCFLKSDFGDLKSFAGAMAGRVVEVRPAVSPEAASLRRSELDYLPSSLRDEADRFAASLATRYDPASQGAAALVDRAESARAEGDAANASELFGRALALTPERFDLWLGMAQVSNAADPDNWQQKQAMREAASAAALNAYLRAVDELQRIQALEALAISLKARQLWRPAIRSYRAALALTEDARLRAAYEALSAEHGFRVTDHQVDSDAAQPRICAVFSEKLQVTRPNLADFVTVEGAPGTSVTVEDSQMCVDGVRHGARYSIAIRPGVPAANGEVLEKPVALDIYVRDRAPSVRFVGRAYVLPKGDDPTIPVVTVNTGRLEAEIFRMADRGLAELVRSNEFLDQLSSWRTQQILDDKGARVWKGTIEVGSQLNTDVTTAIPLDDIGLDLKPGAYALVARVPDDRDNQWGPFATQWFIVSDLGLTAYSGRDGLHVFVRSLASAQALADVPLTLVAANNEVLGHAVSDARGHAVFAPGLSRGTGGLRPAVLGAGAEGGDYAFLDLTKAPFDLTDRGVDGRPAPGPLDVFAYTERGVYRPGSTVHAVALVRDAKAAAQVGVPLTMVFQRPDGVEQHRAVVTDAGLGGHAVDFVLPAGAMRGSWTLSVHADPKADALADVNFLVEDFEPERIGFELETDAERLTADTEATFEIQADYLFGAPAAGLKLQGEVYLRPTREMAAHKGYLFGLADEEAYPNSQPLPGDLVTDADGRLVFDLRLPETPVDTQITKAEVVARLVDAGGRYVDRRIERAVAPDGPRIGIQPQFEDGVGEGGPADFGIIAVAEDGSRMAAEGLSWTLSKLETSYQWFQLNGTWQYDAVTTSRRVETGTLDLTAEAPARLSVPVQWGRYRLEVVGAGSVVSATSVEFSAGWYVAQASAETPDALEVGLDKAKYRPGEIAKLRINPRVAGTVHVAVMADGLIDTKVVDVAEAGETTIDLPVTEAWGAGAYVTATLFRPMDLAARRMPARAVGLQWLGVEPGARDLQVRIETPETMRPNEPLTVPLRLDNLSAGEEAYVTLAAVDVGILNLTRYTPPAPEDWYFGQRALGMEIRDLYGQLIDRMSGVRGAVRSGGDGAGLRAEGPPPTQKPLALFSGIVRVDEDGAATVTFDIPDFNGTVKLMAVAWSAAGVGHGSADVIVRDPVVATVSLPRFLAPGDEARLLVELDNVEGEAGTYSVSLTETAEISIAAADSDLSVELSEKDHRAIRVPIVARTVGDAELTLVVNGPSGPVASRTVALGVRDLQPEISRHSLVTLEPGGTLDLGPETLAGLRAADARVSFDAGSLAGLDVPGLLAALDRYPYGCSEQLTSVALPLLYLNSVAVASGLSTDDALRGRVQEALTGLLSNQSANGAFGVWNPHDGQSLWLDAYVTDFLTRAREADYDVPALAYSQALDNLANSLAYASDFESGGEDVAYALYALTRAGRASIGDVRYYIDTRLDNFATALAQAQLGAAAALYGEQRRATTAFDAAIARLDEEREGAWRYRADYGTRLRDAAATLALAAESKPGIDLSALVDRVRTEAAVNRQRSTQEMAWMLLAANALQERDAAATLTLNATPLPSPVAQYFDGRRLQGETYRLTNEGDAPIDVAMTVTGPSLVPLAADGNGYTLTRETYNLDGSPVDVSAVAQNTRIVVVLRIQALDDRAARLLLVDPLPAGFEIDNPHLVKSGDVAALDWLALDTQNTHTEFRDDRFVVSFDRAEAGNRNATFAYLARAVTPGRYARPPAQVEDMYRPQRFARTDAETIDVLGPNR